jgi:PAS domain S-box-containing protein
LGTTNTAQQFQALFNNAAIGIITVDERGQIIMVNDFGLKQFGYEEQELLGQTIELLLPKRFRNVHEHHREHYHGENAHNRPMGLGMDLFGLKKNGIEFPVEVSLSVYKVEDRRYVISFINDITIRKKAEDDLIRLNEALEEKVKERTYSLEVALEKEKELNELKSRFVSMASHEFRTPLSTILSSAYLVTKYQTEGEQPRREKHIQRIVSSVNMLTDILNDFLSVGRIEEGKIQVRYSEFSMPDIIRSLINEMQTILKSGQRIDYIHTGEEKVILDVTLLKHIIMNLVSNAIKFSPEKSDIIIRSENMGDLITLAIKDAGVGISEGDQQHLFERFFRGENVMNIQGTGLGLHIVGKYAELMNGIVACHSELNKGTEFIINFSKDQSAG